MLSTVVSASSPSVVVSSSAVSVPACSVLLLLSATGVSVAGVSDVAPNTKSTVMWGNDNQRFHNYVVTTEPIAKEDIAEIRANWAELKGSGTYEELVVDISGSILDHTVNQELQSAHGIHHVLHTSNPVVCCDIRPVRRQ